MSCSRGVSSSNCFGGSWRGMRVNCLITRFVIAGGRSASPAATIRTAALSREWESGAELEATAVRRARGHLAAVEPDALADPDEAVSVSVGDGRSGAVTVVANFDPHFVGQVTDGDLRVARTGMLERVR